ncbi:uncharacterized protein LOC100371314 [Saccoglossus kowalevskii]|uniref:Uncharacterized protein LOC100371314 n=1 Tax=Saccoglossus kowalevskii TaxID=10224 RepID=A0ABM0GS06_SACKO|nr:PREDICTED: uncharacterized protein LOC100371314 [Saccoglossus kowalevskii]
MSRWGSVVLLGICFIVVVISEDEEKDPILKREPDISEVPKTGNDVIYDDFEPPYPFEGHIPDVAEVGHFEAINLPTTFETYDIDSNGHVNLTELALATETKEEDAQKPFDDADLNGDGVLDEDEFKKAPWAFEPYSQ